MGLLVAVVVLVADAVGVAGVAAAQDLEVAHRDAAPASTSAAEGRDAEVDDATAVLIDQARRDAAGGVLIRWDAEVSASRRAAVLDAAAPTRTGTVRALSPRVDHVRVAPAAVADTVARLAVTDGIAAVDADRAIVIAPGSRAAGSRLAVGRWGAASGGPAAASGGPRVVTADADVPSAEPTEAVTLPNDPLFGLQWALLNTGQAVGPDGSVTIGTRGVDINLLPAWRTTRGERHVVVAVIDTAVDTTHPDLRGVVVGEFTTASGSSGSRDHGTQVASLIAGRADDGVGIVGVAPNVSVLSIAAFAAVADGSPVVSTLQSVVLAFEVALSAEVDVINASWETPTDSNLLRDAIAEAQVPVVAASGNDFLDLSGTQAVYPASYTLPNLLTVTAVDPRGAVPRFANVGPEFVDLGAPGVSMAVAAEFGGHQWADGTSYAAPLVSGGLALARSAAPYASTSDLIDAVERTSRVLPSLVPTTRTGGMVDVDALVRGVQRPVCTPGLVPPPTFPDVAPLSVHALGIGCAQDLGLVNGQVDGSFQPAAVVTREQLASVLANLLDRVDPAGADDDDPATDTTATDTTPPDDPATDTAATDTAPTDDPATETAPTDDPDPPAFSDVLPTNTHAASIERLAALGIIQGDAGRFRPRDPVTRGQVATFLVGTYEYLVGDAQPPSRRWFSDTSGSVHAASIDRGRDLGVLRGVTRLSFTPGEGTRRDQLASQVAQLVDALGREGVVLR